MRSLRPREPRVALGAFACVPSQLCTRRSVTLSWSSPLHTAPRLPRALRPTPRRLRNVSYDRVASSAPVRLCSALHPAPVLGATVSARLGLFLSRVMSCSRLGPSTEPCGSHSAGALKVFVEGTNGSAGAEGRLRSLGESFVQASTVRNFRKSFLIA